MKTAASYIRTAHGTCKHRVHYAFGLHTTSYFGASVLPLGPPGLEVAGPGTLWMCHTRLRASPKTGHINIFPSPTPNFFRQLCWITQNIFSQHSKPAESTQKPLKSHRQSQLKEKNVFFLFSKQTKYGLELTILSQNQRKRSGYFFTLVLHRPNFHMQCCFYHVFWLNNWERESNPLCSGWGETGYKYWLWGWTALHPYIPNSLNLSELFLPSFKREKNRERESKEKSYVQ